MGSDDELEEFLNTSVPKPLATITRILMKHLGDEITFSALHPHLGLRGRIHGDGLALIPKQVIKYYK